MKKVKLLEHEDNWDAEGHFMEMIGPKVRRTCHYHTLEQSELTLDSLDAIIFPFMSKSLPVGDHLRVKPFEIEMHLVVSQQGSRVLRGALTWWNGRTASMGIDAANGTPWAEVRRWMTEEFCPRSVLQRLEQELYNLKLKGTDIDGYTNRFHELALLCPRMVEPEQVKVEQYIRGLSKNIRGDVTSSQPATIDHVVRMAYQLMGQIIQDKTDEVHEGEKRKGEGDRGGREHELNRIGVKCGKCGKLGHKTAACRCLDKKVLVCDCFNCKKKYLEVRSLEGKSSSVLEVVCSRSIL
ncbi:reverse transcriptase domain-containing protein [Tanacetum coccineum]